MLHDALKKLNNIPFHMPGHKRNAVFGIDGAAIDITEIEGFDNLHNPHGLIAEVETELAMIYHAKKSFLSVGGSTLGMLCAVLAVCEKGDTVIVARNCHKSVYNACLLRELQIVFAEPTFDETHGIYTTLHQSTVETALHRYPQAKAVILTSPTYEGYASDIQADIPIIIDAAHGAHFGLAEYPDYPQGNIVVSSLHKTLPALTQTAVINVYDSRYISQIKFWLDVLETSSPSYVLMNSASICCEFVQTHPQEFENHYALLKAFRKIPLKHLSLMQTDDISKIVISTAGTALNGKKFGKILRERYHIEPEMDGMAHVVLMSTVGDTKNNLDVLHHALLEIDASLQSAAIQKVPHPPAYEGVFKIQRQTHARAIPLSQATGCISNEFIYAYPPDIPVILPGEPIRTEVCAYLKKLDESGISVISDSGMFPNNVLTKIK